MDTPRVTRVLVTVVAAVMVLSVLSAFYDNPQNVQDQSASNQAQVTGHATGLASPMATPDNSTYAVTFQETGLPYGTPWSVTVDGTNTVTMTGATITFELTNGTHSFTVSKPTSYLASPSSGVVFLYGSPVLQYIIFELLEYSVTFTETGLPSGSTWSVDINGQTLTSTTDSIYTSLSNGSYSYEMTGPENYASDHNEGTLVVYGSDVAMNAAFSTTLHKITFNFNGDTSGTSWTILLGGDSYAVSASTMSLYRNNGVYDYAITPANEFSATPASGTVLILDNDASVNVSLHQNTYRVAFEHTGMTVGTSWSVTVGDKTLSSTNSTIVFELPVGDYTYTINGVNGYTAANSTGSVSVSGQGQSVAVDFAKNPDIWSMPLLILAGAAIGIAAGVGVGLYYVRRKK